MRGGERGRGEGRGDEGRGEGTRRGDEGRGEGTRGEEKRGGERYGMHYLPQVCSSGLW